MDTTMVNISHNIPVFHVFVTFMSKSTVLTMRGSREIQEVLPDSLKKADGSLLSLANIGDEDDPKLVNKALPPSKGKEYHPSNCLPTNERQQPSPAPMDFAQVSKIMTDAVFKGINLSSESKISGFSNNVTLVYFMSIICVDNPVKIGVGAFSNQQ
ncbi:hypothetical protein FRACYDRAFT_248822 [Fragilariopsis cylindrus CCMP1102]|uniref:Uncharacterized protein n=1 Tax=Fragilariopsis cylindrus CCMP1102 TaxID=635003 RepID=A0A1E7ETI3_9STRA|nr:hypothetical protein FRACYDRAFT_248822 [Fragilariopsis cylindrus CCMP1102]|eukprot:OEU09338.1 hypothetical protein FRACYDRAFT_248822 [Fragilariopsis cylindrus CCMP1102]